MVPLLRESVEKKMAKAWDGVPGLRTMNTDGFKTEVGRHVVNVCDSHTMVNTMGLSAFQNMHYSGESHGESHESGEFNADVILKSMWEKTDADVALL